MLNLLNLEEKITCGKIKSKAKTLLTGKINYDLVLNKETDNEIIIPTIKMNKIIMNYTSTIHYGIICSYFINSTIIISKSPNPKQSDSHILVLPGYLCELKKIDKNQIEIDLMFKNFFPHNIPINNKCNIFFMIWFKNILPNQLIETTYLSTELIDISINKHNIIDVNNRSLLVQQTQTFNIICKNKTIDTIVKKTNFNNICKGFWIKINLMDYNNFQEFNIELNGYLRLRVTQKNIELICEKKIICNEYILIFLNLELGSSEWNLPQDMMEIYNMYSNSLNASRIDSIKWKFKFTNKFTNDDIQITSLSLNTLSLYDYSLGWEYF